MLGGRIATILFEQPNQTIVGERVDGLSPEEGSGQRVGEGDSKTGGCPVNAGLLAWVVKVDPPFFAVFKIPFAFGIPDSI
jgi:hypothetical protein